MVSNTLRYGPDRSNVAQLDLVPPLRRSLGEPLDRAGRGAARQLVTVLGTLIVAIAAFYFGTNSVQAAKTGQGEPGVG